MVIKKRYHDGQGSPPPPMDESWWEAVLAEEVAQSATATSRGARLTAHTAANTQFSNIEDATEGEPEIATLDWQKATELYEQDQVVSLHVTGCNRGGLLVNGEQLQGFVPISHLIESPCPTVDVEQWLANYVEQSLELKVIECDRERGRVVFSERAAQSSPGSRNLLIAKPEPRHLCGWHRDQYHRFWDFCRFGRRRRSGARLRDFLGQSAAPG